MVVLQVPAGTDLGDEYDLDSTWEALAEKQHGLYSDLSPESIEEGDCFAFFDRNSFAQDWSDTSRKVFILIEDEVHTFVFDEHGLPIHEPDAGVVNGRQPLQGPDGFFEDWRQDYYKLPAVELPEVEDTGDAVAEDGTTPVAVALDNVMSPGARIQQQVADADDPDGTLHWYGAVIAGDRLANGTYIFGFDDGELFCQDPDELKGLFEMGKISACTVNSGLVRDEPQLLKAAAICWCKVNPNTNCPAGVFLSDGMPAEKVGGSTVYHSHYVSIEAMDAILANKQARPVRNAAVTRRGVERERYGHHTIRRGDRLLHIGKQTNQQQQIAEVAFRTLVVGRPKQKDRYVITFDDTLKKFSVNCWTSWERMPATQTADFDPDTCADIEVASSETVAEMLSAWASDKDIRACNTKDKIHKAAQLGPAQKRAANKKSADDKAVERMRKAREGKEKKK